MAAVFPPSLEKKRRYQEWAASKSAAADCWKFVKCTATYKQPPLLVPHGWLCVLATTAVQPVSSTKSQCSSIDTAWRVKNKIQTHDEKKRTHQRMLSHESGGLLKKKNQMHSSRTCTLLGRNATAFPTHSTHLVKKKTTKDEGSPPLTHNTWR